MFIVDDDSYFLFLLPFLCGLYVYVCMCVCAGAGKGIVILLFFTAAYLIDCLHTSFTLTGKLDGLDQVCLLPLNHISLLVMRGFQT